MADVPDARPLQDSLAEWSKALASGASPQGRGFEPHSCHFATICRQMGSSAHSSDVKTKNYIAWRWLNGRAHAERRLGLRARLRPASGVPNIIHEGPHARRSAATGPFAAAVHRGKTAPIGAGFLQCRVVGLWRAAGYGRHTGCMQIVRRMARRWHVISPSRYTPPAICEYAFVGAPTPQPFKPNVCLRKHVGRPRAIPISCVSLPEWLRGWT